MTSGNDSGKDSTWFWWVVSAGVACAALYVLALLIRDVFSVKGLAYTLGLGDGTGLLWPQATAVLTWVFFVEFCALAGVASNYFEGRWKTSKLANLLYGHITFLGWLLRALRALWRAGRWAFTRARQPRAVPVEAASGTNADDFETFGVDEAQAA